MLEVDLSWIATLAVVFVSGIVILWGYTKYLRNRYHHRLLGKVPGLPIIGSVLDLLPDQIIGNFIRYSKQYGPFVEYYIFFQRALLISDDTIAKEIFRYSPKMFVRSRNVNYPTKVLRMETSLFLAEGALWSRVRKATAPSFSNHNVNNKFPVVVKEMYDWMKRMYAQQTGTSKNNLYDMRFETFSLTIRIITVLGFNLPIDHPVNQHFLSERASNDMKTGFQYMFEATIFPLPKWMLKYTSKGALEKRAMEANDRTDHYLRAILAYKRQVYQQLAEIPKHESMIDSILYYHDQAATDNKTLSDEEIIANMKTFYLGGTDTSAVTISWMTMYFAMYPIIVAKIREEVLQVVFAEQSKSLQGLDFFSEKGEAFLSHCFQDVAVMKRLVYCQAVMKETLRLRGPASFLGTELESATEPHTLSNGITIYPGDFIMISLDGIHYSEQYFHDAEAFKPERWLEGDEKQLMELESHFIPFGYGPRVCPGMYLAQQEILLGAVFLALHYDFELGCDPKEIIRIPNFVSIPSKMPIRLIPYKW